MMRTSKLLTPPPGVLIAGLIIPDIWIGYQSLGHSCFSYTCLCSALQRWTCHILRLNRQQVILLANYVDSYGSAEAAGIFFPTVDLNAGNWAVQFIHRVSLWLQGYSLPGANSCFPLSVLLHHVMLSERQVRVWIDVNAVHLREARTASGQGIIRFTGNVRGSVLVWIQTFEWPAVFVRSLLLSSHVPPQPYQMRSSRTEFFWVHFKYILAIFIT